MKDLEQSEREMARWVVLQALYHGDGNLVAERLILSVLEAVPIKASASDVRAYLSYVASAGLAQVEQFNHGAWGARITRTGVDVVEYNSECPAGIARPKKYW